MMQTVWAQIRLLPKGTVWSGLIAFASMINLVSVPSDPFKYLSQHMRYYLARAYAARIHNYMETASKVRLILEPQAPVYSCTCVHQIDFPHVRLVRLSQVQATVRMTTLFQLQQRQWLLILARGLRKRCKK